MIAVQTAVGDVGNKATTELSLTFNSLVNTGKFQYGLNENGIFRINTGEQDVGIDYERTFTLSTSDLGQRNIKRFRFIYIGADVDESFIISVMGDNKVWQHYYPDLTKTGIQTIRKSITRNGQGRYWKIKITSIKRFRIDNIMGLFIIRPLGIRG